MTHAESLELLSYLSGCYVLGWCLGYGLHVFKVLSEKI